MAEVMRLFGDAAVGGTAFEPDAARGGGQQPGDQAQQRRLSRAVRSD